MPMRRFATLLRAQGISRVDCTPACCLNPTFKWGNVEMENVFCKLKTENEKVLSAYRIAWQDKFFPSIWYRLNVECWMLNRMNGWTNECQCVNSEWVSECVSREINSLIARTGCAQSASSAKSVYTDRWVCVCVWVYECECECADR